MKYIILDLDGTLCDCSHRVHLAQAKAWDQFHELCHLDEPFPDVMHVVDAFARDPDYQIVAVTGRNEKFRQTTYDWFAKHGLLHKIDQLLMRPDGNFDKDGAMKVWLIVKAGMLFEDIAFALDDRDSVVSAFREAGIAAYQVRDGSY